MPEPKYGDVLEHEYLKVCDEDATDLITKVANRQASAAYWQGRCEALEQAIGEIKAAHQREIASLKAGFDSTLSYLKDRLNRLEVKPKSAYDEDGQ